MRRLHTVTPGSAVCAAFATKPSAYSPSTRKTDVAPTCGSIAGTANAEKERLQANFSRGRSRKRRSRINKGGRPSDGLLCLSRKRNAELWYAKIFQQVTKLHALCHKSAIVFVLLRYNNMRRFAFWWMDRII